MRVEMGAPVGLVKISVVMNPPPSATWGSTLVSSVTAVVETVPATTAVRRVPLVAQFAEVQTPSDTLVILTVPPALVSAEAKLAEKKVVVPETIEAADTALTITLDPAEGFWVK